MLFFDGLSQDFKAIQESNDADIVNFSLEARKKASLWYLISYTMKKKTSGLKKKITENLKFQFQLKDLQ